MKKAVPKNSKHKITKHVRGFPIWIRDGKLIDPKSQVDHFLADMFYFIEHSGDAALQANMEITILTKAK